MIKFIENKTVNRNKLPFTSGQGFIRRSLKGWISIPSFLASHESLSRNRSPLIWLVILTVITGTTILVLYG